MSAWTCCWNWPNELADAALAVSVSGLTKSYGHVVAVDEVAMSVEAGEIFGLLGPNGAGKTTLVKILVGLIRANSGAASIFQDPAGTLAAKRAIGYLPEHFSFPDWMTAKEFLEFHGRLASVNADSLGQKVGALLERVGLSARADSRLGTFSKGMLQRIGIAQALVGDPKVAFLDEPTSALDPIGRRDVRDLMRDLRVSGVTVFLNSHLLSEIEMVCDRVSILNNGKVVAHGTLGELLSARRLSVRVNESDLARIRAALGEFDVAIGEAGRLVFKLSDEEDVPRVVRALVDAGADVHEVAVEASTLEELFVELVEPGDR